MKPVKIRTAIASVSDKSGLKELTTEALIEACPFEHIKVNAKDVTIQTLN